MRLRDADLRGDERVLRDQQVELARRAGLPLRARDPQCDSVARRGRALFRPRSPPCAWSRGRRRRCGPRRRSCRPRGRAAPRPRPPAPRRSRGSRRARRRRRAPSRAGRRPPTSTCCRRSSRSSTPGRSRTPTASATTSRRCAAALASAAEIELRSAASSGRTASAPLTRRPGVDHDLGRQRRRRSARGMSSVQVDQRRELKAIRLCARGLGLREVLLARAHERGLGAGDVDGVREVTAHARLREPGTRPSSATLTASSRARTSFLVGAGQRRRTPARRRRSTLASVTS